MINENFTPEGQARHMIASSKIQTEATSLLRVTMWILFLLSTVVAYISRISMKDGKTILNKVLVGCRIVKENPKKTKYS